MVDEVKIHLQKIDVTQDIIMKGHVTWSGRSSLEIGMWLSQNEEPVMDAQFVMVARDAATMKYVIKKSKLFYNRDVAPKRVTSSGIGLQSSEKILRRWRAVGDCG